MAARKSTYVRLGVPYVYPASDVQRLCTAGRFGKASDHLVIGSLEYLAWLRSYDGTLAVKTGRALDHNENVYTLRREARRNGLRFWYAYQRIGGKLYKAYAGADIDLTCHKLITLVDVLQVKAGKLVQAHLLPARPVAPGGAVAPDCPKCGQPMEYWVSQRVWWCAADRVTQQVMF